MKIIIPIEHPAWAHQYQHIIHELIKRGHTVKVLVLEKDNVSLLLDKFHIKYEYLFNINNTHFFIKLCIYFLATIKAIYINYFYRADIFFGRASPIIVLLSLIFRKKIIIFEDTENIPITLNLCKYISAEIYTPISFRKNLGKNHHRINTIKELFYLKPKLFKPDKNVLTRYHLDSKSTFYFLRFVRFNAQHDLGKKGMSMHEKLSLAKYLSRTGKVIISSESPLPTQFNHFTILKFSNDIHHLLFFARMYVGESVTVGVEAGILGTPSILIHDSVMSEGRAEYFKKTGIMYTFSDYKHVWKKIQSVNTGIRSKKIWQKAANKFIQQSIKPNSFFIKILSKFTRS